MRRWAPAIGAVVMAVLLLACSAPGPDRTASPPPASSPPAQADESAGVVSVVVYGDSNTTGFSGTLEAGMDAGVSWAAHLPPDDYSVVAGWARDGATTSEMAASAEPAPGSDLLLIMGGTNDLARGISVDEIPVNLARIVETVGAARVALVAVAPLDPLPDEADRLNVVLRTYADAQGWDYIDPWAQLREADGTWRSAYTVDGIHSTPEGYALVGAAVAEGLR